MRHLITLAALTAVAVAPCAASARTTPAQSADTSSADPLARARELIAARKLDSAATLIRSVAEASSRSTSARVEAWVLLGVVDFYRAGDSATAFAFRQALALDPAFEVTLSDVDPAIPRILAAERAALAPGAPPPPPTAAAAAAAAATTAPVHDCLGKCPEGVRPPSFTFFPHIDFSNAAVGFSDRRMRTNASFQVVIGADGIIEPETLIMSAGTARGVEAEVRRGLIQARFAPGRANGVPCRTRVMLRFDFEAEGTSWVKYTYRVVAR